MSKVNTQVSLQDAFDMQAKQIIDNGNDITKLMDEISELTKKINNLTNKSKTINFGKEGLD